MTDPRPDLKGDSKEWTTLLRLAHWYNYELAGVLHGFRCGGLRLHRPIWLKDNLNWPEKIQEFPEVTP